jgi:primosomal protein N' (replication factor Y) (superfamily II helicase)
MPLAANLFGDEPADDGPLSLFVEIVFDRPLDFAFSYGVPDELRDRVRVGGRVACPFGRGDRLIEGFVVRVTETVPERPVKPIAKVLDDEPLLDEHLLKLTRWMADYYLCGWGQVLQAVVPAGVRDKAGTRSVAFVAAVPSEELPNPLPSVTPKQKRALEVLRAATEPMELNALARQLGGAGAIHGLVSKGIIRKFSERIERKTEADSSPHSEIRIPNSALVLNADQQRAWDTIRPALNSGGFHPFLLHGITGSGKTEIYLRAIEEVVKQGKEAIVLVPEISLTPQTIERFSGRCESVAVLHSHLTDAERGQYWRRVAAGQIQVVVGARSAVFAPARKLGLIVIDEEHETSFKQESTPRYHARDVAVMRARLADVPILLGSATPSLESWYNAHRPNGYSLVSLPNRVENRPLPKVELIDLRHEAKTPGKHFAIGPTLEKAVRDALKAGGQVMLFLNRRGFSTHVHCPSCGHVAQCAHCDLALTFHRHKSALVCHYCGWETAPFTKCPACSQVSIRYQGLGTEKLQEEIESKFPNKVVQRMDSDTMGKHGSHRRVLDAFRDGKIHILLGTQMIAKGLDFPNVTLVGVVNADTGLHLPDFRAAERTFQLLAQVSGRAGRGDKGGRVMIQTFTPEHPCIALATHHDFVEFSKQELGHRKEHQYPPYQRLARLIVRSENETAAGAYADTLAGAFAEALKRHVKPGTPPVRLLGPAECPVFKLKGYYRFHFQVQSAASGALHAVLREVLSAAKPPSGVEFQVDVDPYSML